MKVIRTIVGYDNTSELEREQLLKLFNWSTIEDSRKISENIIIHNILSSKKPYAKYVSLTNDRSEEQIKYKHINTNLRSQESYNVIPLNIRNKNINEFKISYKLHSYGLKINPSIVKKNLKNTYMLIWPGS